MIIHLDKESFRPAKRQYCDNCYEKLEVVSSDDIGAILPEHLQERIEKSVAGVCANEGCEV